MSEEELKNFEEIASTLTENITDTLDNIFNFYEQIYKDKIFYRKIRFKGKIKKRYMISHNMLCELLPSPKLLTFGLKPITKRM